MRRDPSEPRERLRQVAALNYFTDREDAIRAFRRCVQGAEADALRVLVFYGVGDWAETQRALGLTYQALADATGQPEYAVKAEEHLAAARRVTPAG